MDSAIFDCKGKKMNRLYTLIFLIVSFCSFAQGVKTEKEFRLSEEEAPEVAREWMSLAFQNAKRIKWYFEEGKDSQSYEAKFKLNSKKYSVEFDKAGAIEDVEIGLSWNKMDKEIKQKLQTSFGQFEKFKLRKIQKQWSAPTSKALKEAIINNQPEGIIQRYEVEFRARIDGVLSYWEGLFDKEGVLIQKVRIITRATDNFDF